jgi:hypothetical protein
MTVIDIIEDWLREHGYDGLCDPDAECGCSIDHVCPCCENCINCQPGYLHRNGLIYLEKEKNNG